MGSGPTQQTTGRIHPQGHQYASHGIHGTTLEPILALSEGVKDMTKLMAAELSKYLKITKTVMTTGNYAAVILISYTGMRARETTALRWSDVDFERKRIMVMRTAIETAGGH